MIQSVWVHFHSKQPRRTSLKLKMNMSVYIDIFMTIGQLLYPLFAVINISLPCYFITTVQKWSNWLCITSLRADVYYLHLCLTADAKYVHVGHTLVPAGARHLSFAFSYMHLTMFLASVQPVCFCQLQAMEPGGLMVSLQSR